VMLFRDARNCRIAPVHATFIRCIMKALF